MSNPAQRLHAILTRSKRPELTNNKMLVGWRNVLNLPEHVDDLIVMSKIGKVFTLPSVITTHIERFPDLSPIFFLVGVTILPSRSVQSISTRHLANSAIICLVHC